MPSESQKVKRKRPRFPWFGREQLWVTVSLVVVMIGTMLPWFRTFLGTRYGLDGWGMLAMWGAALGLVGAFSIKERTFRILPAVGSAVALLVVVLMAVDGARVCSPGADGTAPCAPGFGLILTGAAAINALLWSVRGYLALRDE